MDNRVFNVNGRTKEQLKLTLQLALHDEYGKDKTVSGWRTTQDHGLILLWHVSSKDHVKFPVELNYEQLVEIVWSWLKSDDAKKVKQTGWDVDSPHDGHNNIGWRVYCEDWGHVADDHYAIVAIKPAYLWYGK